MLSIQNLHYRIGSRTLFDGASAQLAAGWKVGLVGRNGTGKSTLLRLIRDAYEAPSRDNDIQIAKDARLGWVAQEVAPSEETLLSVVLVADQERASLMREADTAEDPLRIAEIHERLVDIDAWSGEARAAEVLTGLGFTQADLSRPTREFSGGWRMRAALAGVLFAQPELLLLDEPTNYLDLEGAAWLETYLKTYPHTVILVSHDRDLLNRCVTHTLALEHLKLHLASGGYDAWLELRSAKTAQLEAQRQKQDVEKAHLQSFIDRFRYKESKARQAQSRIKRLEKMKDISIPLEERTVPFKFESGEEKLAPPMLMLEQAQLGYGEDALILDKVDLRIDPDDRIAIVGTNGQGKTTLVKSIAERLPLMSGLRKAPKAIRIGYFSQDQMDELRVGETVLDHVRRALPKGLTMAQQRSAAAGLGFSHEKVDTAVEHLSGGEKVRLLMGLMAMEKPNILILDEPTSHLDIDSREALIHALNGFEGAVLLITHDVFLAEATADQLWLVKDGCAKPYDGDLDDYRSLILSTDRAVQTAEPQSKPVETTSDRADRRRAASQRREAARPLKKRIEAAEKVMENAQGALAKIDAKLSEAGVSSDELTQLMKDRAVHADRHEAAETDWLEASEAYEAAIAETS